jgi:uncharacterized protein (TIGR00725 family)
MVMEKVSRKPIVGVIGASSAPESTLTLAEAVGKAIGAEGWHLLTGGGGGVMRAAARGFSSADVTVRGVSIGVLPAEDADSANEFVEVPLPTGIGLARNAIVARAAQALVAIGGCSGTLSEMALGWQFNRPIVALSVSGGWAEKLAGTRVDGRYEAPIFDARDVPEVVDFLKGKLP